ncbi:Sigma-70 region 2 [Ruminococcaceae bacterium FB2012]|nr:Sigma-70 region 2 [Ruminococcaceae bacterium FB2012]
MIPMIYLSVLKSEEDKVKFEEIYNEYRQALFLSAYSILHDPEDAEDVVEDTFLTVADNFTEISKKAVRK